MRMTEIAFNYCSKAMSRYVSVQMLLPFDAFHPDRCPPEPYKTLYFLNRYLANARQILSTINLSAYAQQYGFAVVIPDGENSFYVDQPKRNALYETYVARELVAVTRKLFPLSKQRENTFIGGISMGGFGALMLGARNLGTFSKIIALSPAARIYDLLEQGCLPSEEIANIFGSKENYLRKYDPLSLLKRAKSEGKQLPDIFLCCGTEDPLTYHVSCSLKNELRTADIPVEYREGPGVHDSFYWNRALPDAIQFLMNR